MRPAWDVSYCLIGARKQNLSPMQSWGIRRRSICTVICRTILLGESIRMGIADRNRAVEQPAQVSQSLQRPRLNRLRSTPPQSLTPKGIHIPSPVRMRIFTRLGARMALQHPELRSPRRTSDDASRDPNNQRRSSSGCGYLKQQRGYKDTVGAGLPPSAVSPADATKAYNSTPVTITDTQTQTLTLPNGCTCRATSTRTVTNTTDGKTISPGGYTLTTTQPVVSTPKPPQ
jgi:hypothetical protein